MHLKEAKQAETPAIRSTTSDFHNPKCPHFAPDQPHLEPSRPTKNKHKPDPHYRRTWW